MRKKGKQQKLQLNPTREDNCHAFLSVCVCVFVLLYVWLLRATQAGGFEKQINKIKRKNERGFFASTLNNTIGWPKWNWSIAAKHPSGSNHHHNWAVGLGGGVQNSPLGEANFHNFSLQPTRKFLTSKPRQFVPIRLKGASLWHHHRRIIPCCWGLKDWS